MSLIDGKYGAATATHVQAIQANGGITQDGITGPATCRLLHRSWAYFATNGGSNVNDGLAIERLLYLNYGLLSSTDTVRRMSLFPCSLLCVG